MKWWPARRSEKSVEQPDPRPEVVRGPAHVVTDEVDTSSYVASDAGVELRRLVDAIREVDGFLKGLGLESSYADVFRTQNAILNDVTWIRAATHAITNGSSAPAAVFAAFADLSSLFDGLDNPTLKERGTDVRSMSRLVRSALVGDELRRPEPGVPSVWVVDELDAATAMQLSSANCTGVVATSELVSGHGIEIATSRGFPCVTGRTDFADTSDGDQIDLIAN